MAMAIRAQVAELPAAAAAGTGWREVYLGGSQEAEETLINEQLAPEINRIQLASEHIRGRRKALRALHSKMIAGTKHARFEVLEDIPSDLRVGPFQPGKSYTAEVRFSSASSVEQPDIIRDLRGIAFRIKDDAGKHYDFLMTSAPYSHVRDAREFVLVASAVVLEGTPAFLWRNGTWRKLAGLVRIARQLGVSDARRVLKTISRQTAHVTTSLATESYWSRAPFAFGDVAVKYRLVPSTEEVGGVPPIRNTQDLRAELISRLRERPVEFDFQVQRFVDEARTPIEDASVDWKAEDAPFVTLAHLVVPPQVLNVHDEEAIERHSFSPWNTGSGGILPIGNMNRARKQTYHASVTLRRKT
jgi:hypothetical protein